MPPPWLSAIKPRTLGVAAWFAFASLCVIDTGFSFVFAPRFMFWTLAVVSVFVALASLQPLTRRSVLTMYGVVASTFVISILVDRILDAARGFEAVGVNLWPLVARVGSVSLALLVLAYLDPMRRRNLRSVLASGGSVAPRRAVGVGLLALLALVPIARAFTGPFDFGFMGLNGGDNFAPSEDPYAPYVEDSLLWRVRSDVARQCSAEFGTSLFVSDQPLQRLNDLWFFGLYAGNEGAGTAEVTLSTGRIICKRL